MIASHKTRHGYAGHRPAQDELLAYLKEVVAGGGPISLDGIRRHMGWKRRRSAKDALRNLAHAGLLPELLAPLIQPEWRGPSSHKVVESWAERKLRRRQERASA